jgi:hypothetical protein
MCSVLRKLLPETTNGSFVAYRLLNTYWALIFPTLEWRDLFSQFYRWEE